MTKLNKPLSEMRQTYPSIPDAMERATRRNNEKIFVIGYHPDSDVGGGNLVYDANRAKSDHNGGTVIDPDKTFPTDWNDSAQVEAWFTDDGVGNGVWVRSWASALPGIATVQADWFGARAVTGFDSTAPIVSAYNIVKSVSGATLVFSGGVYEYDDLGNLASDNTTIKGAGFRQTVLSCTRTTGDRAITIDAFSNNDPNEPFIQGFNLEDIIFEGNGSLTVGLYVRGIARSRWKNIYFRELNSTSGIAYLLEGVQLSEFNGLDCTTKIDQNQTSVPYEGLRLAAGARAGVSVGNSSNNQFNHTYYEGLSIGRRLSGADQNIFQGGSPEDCSIYGQLVASGCRYNTFIGVGFENLGATADIDDSGTYSRYINCYSSEKTLVKGKGAHFEGSYFERFEITAAADGTSVDDITVNNWNTASGGYFDSGTGTKWRNVFDIDLGTYIYKSKARFAVTVGASPFTYQNLEGVTSKIRVIDGTVTEVLIYRGGDFWEEAKPTAKNTGTVGTYLLQPGDEIRVAYSAAPTMNVIPMNGL